MPDANKGNFWTVETLKEHFEQRFVDQEKAVSAALAAAEKAVAAALAAAEKAREQAADDAKLWRASANEWRAAMNDREQKFAMKPEVEGSFKAVEAEIRSLRETRAEGVGGKALIALLVMLIVGASAAVGLLARLAGK